MHKISPKVKHKATGDVMVVKELMNMDEDAQQGFKYEVRLYHSDQFFYINTHFF